MQLEHYISDLLYRYQCVTIPGFGAFITQQQSAQINKETHTFFPPSKKIAFNAQLNSNDGLLTKYIADVDGIAYEKAAVLLQEKVGVWQQALQQNEVIALEQIGSLSQNEEGKIIFAPNETTNYLTTSFGLASFGSTPVLRESLKEEVAALEEKAPIVFTPESKKNRSYLKYAAIFLLSISAGTLGFKLVKDANVEQHNQVAEQQAQDQVQKNIQEATFFDAAPLELPSVTVTLKKEPLNYHIVAGAFRVEENADKKVDELIEQGYQASRIGKNKYGLYQVAYASFNNSRDAINYLNSLKKTKKVDAWYFVSKN
ncbi:SPOR domain-containing protein [Zhouia sp. PK063]|uniref:HU domain-containing protein n=1 Tax=Zhouia sp. PK063 TaxID=3373602 RepID=UPI0037A53DA9